MICHPSVQNAEAGLHHAAALWRGSAACRGAILSRRSMASADRKMRRLESSEPQVLTAQLVNRPTTHQLHVAFDLIVEILKSSFDAGLPRGCEGIQVKSASRTRFRAQGEGFQNVGASANPPAPNHIYLVADGIHDLGELVEWAPRPVELTSAV